MVVEDVLVSEIASDLTRFNSIFFSGAVEGRPGSATWAMGDWRTEGVLLLWAGMVTLHSVQLVEVAFMSKFVN